MLSKDIGQIDYPQLLSLVDVVSEDKTLEFKREMPAKTRDEVVKFLAAVTSLANTAGGDLVLGVVTEEGLVKSVPGIAYGNLDAEKLRFEQLLASSVEPRLPPVEMRFVGCENGSSVLLLRVPRSWSAPHRVKTDDKFYGRNSAGKSQS